MASLLVVIFCVELAVQLVNTIGAATINGLIWDLVVRLPIPLSREFAVQRQKQKEYLEVRRELTGTSSQDEFAKWAKLRRKHDKLLEDLEKKKAALDGSRTKFDRYLTTARFISTRGLQWFLPFWYGRTPMFWLPYGSFPYYVEWFASFPRAPLGSVSIVVWQGACTGMLTLLVETVTAILGLAVAARQQPAQKEKPNKQAAPAGGVETRADGAQGTGRQQTGAASTATKRRA